MTDNLLMKVDGDRAAIDPVMQDTLAVAYDSDLIDRCVDLKVAGLVRWDAIHRRLNSQVEYQDEHLAPETVQACLNSKAFSQRWQEARQDPQGWLTRRLRRVQQVHRTLDVVEDLAAPTNADKRTRTANAQFRLGIAGITPQTQISVGPNEDFLKLVEKALTKRNGNGDV